MCRERRGFNFGGYDNPFADQQADDFELVSFLVLK